MKSGGPRWPSPGLLAAALMMFWCLPAAAQSPTTGSLGGQVVEPSGAATTQVLVTMSDSAHGVHRMASSDRDGRFGFRLLPAGEYDLVVEKLGYVPRRILDVPVRPGRELNLTVVLEPTSSTSPPLSETRYGGAVLRRGLPGASLWIDEAVIDVVPARRNALGDLLRLTSVAGPDLSSEGLPPWLSGTEIDGVRMRSAGSTFLSGTQVRGAAVPLNGIASARLAIQELDVESRGAAGAQLNAQTRTGSGSTSIDAAADWSGSALPGASFADDADSFNEVNARAAIAGPLGDSSTFAIGFDMRRVREPLSAAWPESEAAAALVELAGERDVDLSGYGSPALAYDEAISAFAGADIALSESHRLRLGAHGSTLPRVSTYDRSSGLRSELEGHEAIASVSLFSIFGDRTANELRAGFTSSDRTSTDTDSLSPVFIVEDALSFGSLHPGSSAAARSVSVTDALHYRAGAHALKFGAAARIDMHDVQHRAGAAGEYLFASIDAMRADSGVFLSTVGPAAGADWSDLTYSAFVQDVWTAVRGLDVSIGVRADRMSLPVDNVRRDTEWLRLSGLANDDVPASRWLVSPRVGVTWDPSGDQRWILHVAGGIYHDAVDPLLLSQWQIDDGRADNRAAVGTVRWLEPMTYDVEMPRLTVLASSFAPPQSTRVTAGIAHSLDARTSVHVSGVIRRTTNLPRSTDLNRLPLPAARDQYGRPVYGELVKQGGLLVREPGTGRRFSEYDEVAAISADGESDHWGVTVGIDRDLADGLGVLARYTYARTTDNWFGAAQGGWMVPLPQDAGDEWLDGTSDFDVPHRLSAALFYRAPFGVELAGVYRLESGLPFTPSFRTGVDANADGSLRNDAAFVDGGIAGMDELMSEWSCLGESEGALAARNSCRTDAVHTLDLRAAVTVLRFAGASASLAIEAFDLLEGTRTVPDAALYLIDPAADLVTDTEARTVTVPLIVNEAFGTELTRRHSGRKLRLGISLNW
ncbi:MAG TPA: TonB-dependent receptor [Longimicrobiales bacterium]|nr:TonB-dependent receptor [Longimicrobiales bacterium]